MADPNHEKNKAILDQLYTGDTDSVKQIYEKWSDSYEQDLLGMANSYTHPEKIAMVAAEHVTDKSAKILDVCAGTGLGGVALKKVGFSNIDAVDGSPAMLEKARAKGVYGCLFEEIIDTDRVRSVPEGSYDAVITSGSFLPGHLGPGHLRPLAGVIRSGGFFVMALREDFIRDEFLRELEPEMNRMEEAGVWKKISWHLMDHYYNNLPGKVYVYKKM